MNRFFNEHPSDGLHLNHNTTPVADCSCTEEVLYGEKVLVTEVPVLTCRGIWRRFQQEAEQIVAPHGVLIADPLLRTRAINAAYARLWLSDQRFQWAGLAAHASRQMDFGLLQLHAEDKIELIRQEHEARQHDRHVYDLLAMGNTTVFLDIYPLHRFYSVRGLEELKKCLNTRKTIYGHAGFPVLWPVEEKTLPFGLVTKEILKGFEAVEAGNICESVEHLTVHELRNVLQPAIYENRHLTTLLRGADWFDFNQRMESAQRAATRFDRLLNDGNRSALVQSIHEIADIEGV